MLKDRFEKELTQGSNNNGMFGLVEECVGVKTSPNRERKCSKLDFEGEREGG